MDLRLVLPPALGEMLLLVEARLWMTRSRLYQSAETYPHWDTEILPTLGRLRVLVGDDSKGMPTIMIRQSLRTSCH